MDSESDVPENSIILLPEDLVRLGVKVDSLTTASSDQPYNGHNSKQKSSENKNEKNRLRTVKHSKKKASLPDNKNDKILQKVKHSKNKASLSDKNVTADLDLFKMASSIENKSCHSRKSEDQDEAPSNKPSFADNLQVTENCSFEIIKNENKSHSSAAKNKKESQLPMQNKILKISESKINSDIGQNSTSSPRVLKASYSSAPDICVQTQSYSDNQNSSLLKGKLESCDVNNKSVISKERQEFWKVDVEHTNNFDNSIVLADNSTNATLNESSLDTSITIVPLSDNSTDVPKKAKRGRPRKSDKVDEQQKFEIPLFDTFPLLNTSQQCVSNIPKKAKRGRPRKSELPITDPESCSQTSAKGRQTRQVLYCSDEDPEYETVKKKAKRAPKKKQTLSDISLEEQMISTEQLDAESSAIIGIETDDSDMVDKDSWKFANEDIFQQILNDEMVKSTDKRFDGSGKKGRKPKFSKDLEDGDGTSVCAVCNKSMPNKDWLTHRMQVHNNLTWRKGDLSFDVGDYAIVQRAFKEVKAVQKYLQCFKCFTKTTSIPEFSRHLEACYGIVKDGCVTCAICRRRVDTRTWSIHRYIKHNNLAWRLGDTPLDLQDKGLVLRILKAIYKARKPLRCEICNLQKKSTMGYVSHKIQCIASLTNKCSKVACDVCGRFVLPVSLEFHMKTFHSLSNNVPILKWTVENLVEEGVSKPRKAAENAMEVIQKISNNESKIYCPVKNCDFRNYWISKALKNLHADLPELACLFPNCDFKCPSDKSYPIGKHMLNCPNKPITHFICKLCLVFFEHEFEVQNHCQDVHKMEAETKNDLNFVQDLQDSKEDVLIDMAAIEKSKIRIRNRVAISKNPSRATGKPMFLGFSLKELSCGNLIYFQAFPWMYSFCEKHFNNPTLFAHYRNGKPWQVLDCDLLNKYLPYHHESCDISVRAVELNIKNSDAPVFRKMDLFESYSFYEGEATIFCGGPITAMAWMPTPYNIETMNQIVALAVSKNAEAVYNARESYSEPCIIQFWNCGPLDSQQSKFTTPELLYGLALNAGPVWHIEWCPSGCLDVIPNKENKPSRLGLLAVATSDSLVYIYSIDDVRNEDDRGIIYKSNPIIKLKLTLNKGCSVQDYYATKISWTKAGGHRYIAVGYSNGVIAMFDLFPDCSSPLLQSKQPCGTHVIFSYNRFQAHSAAVTGISLNHLLGGNRWCCSTSSDKLLIFWDLESNSVQSESGCLKRFGLSEVIWPTLWPLALATEDEAHVNKNSQATVLSKSIRSCYVLRENTIKISDSVCGLRGVSFSDWLNAVLFGGTSGEVSVQFIHRLIHGADRIPKRKNLCLKHVFSNAKLVTKTQPVDPSKEVAYKSITDQYGIDFRDFNSSNQSLLPNQRDKTLDQAEIDKYDIHKYPLNAVNKVAVNPNCQAYPYYAVGYQAGFLRIRSITCIKGIFEPFKVPGHDFAANL